MFLIKWPKEMALKFSDQPEQQIQCNISAFYFRPTDVDGYMYIFIPYSPGFKKSTNMTRFLQCSTDLQS